MEAITFVASVKYQACLFLVFYLTEENYDILLQECQKLLISAMKNFPEEEGVQTACFAFIDAVAINSKNTTVWFRNMLAWIGGVGL